jgi:hypothetical protein
MQKSADLRREPVSALTETHKIPILGRTDMVSSVSDRCTTFNGLVECVLFPFSRNPNSWHWHGPESESGYATRADLLEMITGHRELAF